MSITGEALMLIGGGISKILGFHIGTVGSNSMQNVSSVCVIANNDYFTINNNNTFICQKGGTYTVYYAGKSCYMNSGTRRDAAVHVYVNNSSVATFNTSGTWFAVYSVQITLQNGDSVALKGRNLVSSSNLEPLFMIITSV